MYFIGYNFYHNKRPWTLNSLINHLNLPFDPVNDVLNLLKKNSLLSETADDPPAYLPSKALDTITLRELLNAVRIADKGALDIEKQVIVIPQVDYVMKSLDTAITDVLGDRSLKDIVIQ
jgi:membrane protein